MTTPGSSNMDPGLPEALTTSRPSVSGTDSACGYPASARPSMAPGTYQPEQLSFTSNSQSSESHIPHVEPMETIPEEVTSVNPSYGDISPSKGPDRSARIIPLAHDGSQAAADSLQSPYGVTIHDRADTGHSVDLLGFMGCAHAEGSAQASHAITDPTGQVAASPSVNTLQTPGFRVVEGLGHSPPQPQPTASIGPVDEAPLVPADPALHAAVPAPLHATNMAPQPRRDGRIAIEDWEHAIASWAQAENFCDACWLFAENMTTPLDWGQWCKVVYRIIDVGGFHRERAWKGKPQGKLFQEIRARQMQHRFGLNWKDLVERRPTGGSGRARVAYPDGPRSPPVISHSLPVARYGLSAAGDAPRCRPPWPPVTSSPGPSVAPGVQELSTPVIDSA